jgi:EAL domain-containing protein (putative c-di-GMP-specific phosphodiesterase class I)
MVLAIGSIATAVLALLETCNVGGERTRFEDAMVVVAAATATLALAIMARRHEVGGLRYRQLAVAIALTGAAMVILNVAPSVGEAPAVIAANLLFVCGCVASLSVIVPSLYRRLDRQALAMAGLDGGIMISAGVTLVFTVWRTGQGTGDIGEMLVLVLAATLFASAGLAAIVAFNVRAAPAFRGVWSGIVGASIVGLSWILWADVVFRGQTRDPLTSLLYSIGILLVGHAWMTWNEDVGRGAIYERFARGVVDWLPIGAILLCVGVAAVPHARVDGIDPAPVGTAAVVLFSIARQRLLITRERWASRSLAGEVEERSQTMLSLSRLERADSLERTAYKICDEALRLVGIDAARVYAFGEAGVVPLALEGVSPGDETNWEPIDGARALHLVARASAGAWIDTASDPSLPLAGGLSGEAFAPMRWDDRIVGLVSMGTTSLEDARRLALRLSTLTEFGVFSAALLGPMLTEHWRMADIRSQLGTIITNRAFMPVFQPVVRLLTRETVGFEALTRFNDGTRPDQRFEEAETAGMGVQLEIACIAEQLEAATWLPPGTWLSLNVSPALASAIVPLISALEAADRDVVLEITEHVEISDYRQLVDALDLIRGKARLAVDDAGAGYAGLRHILELRPQFVKLDISLVRHIDTDPARQAMVAGMDHFAHNAGCELIAEGIETEDELNQLIHLGISLGQGYLLGKPGPVLTD